MGTTQTRITRDPQIMNGQACIRGMRLTVRRVLEAMALYPNHDELFTEYLELEPDDLKQALAPSVFVFVSRASKVRISQDCWRK